MTAKDRRLLAQANRALIRVSDWLGQLDEPVDGRLADHLGELIHATDEDES